VWETDQNKLLTSLSEGINFGTRIKVFKQKEREFLNEFFTYKNCTVYPCGITGKQKAVKNHPERSESKIIPGTVANSLKIMVWLV
jgi:hypothetical protein